jgi:16S rRNA (uracil1498-N3)-methyltransferase
VRRVRRDEVDLDLTRAAVAPPPTPRLVVVQALAKGERGELAVELLTEVGADRIVPWAASRAVVRWDGERGPRSLERWRSTAREAAKQSRRVWWPEVTELASTRDVAALLRAADAPVVLHEQAPDPIGGAVADLAAPDEIVLVVGPEGGITPEELELFAGAGARTARLGPTVLRTSSAGVVAAAVILADTGRWR